MLRQIAGFGMLYALESVFLMKQNDLYFYKHLVMSDLCCVNNKAYIWFCFYKPKYSVLQINNLNIFRSWTSGFLFTKLYFIKRNI